MLASASRWRRSRYTPPSQAVKGKGGDFFAVLAKKYYPALTAQAGAAFGGMFSLLKRICSDS